MLVKSICVHCHDLYRVRTWARQPAKERDWGRGRMACVAMCDKGLARGGLTRYVKVDGDPPKFCYFLLEQTVSQPDPEIPPDSASLPAIGG